MWYFRKIAVCGLFLSMLGLVCGAQTVKLTYMYWGSPAEDAATRNALADFEKANPGIRVEPLFAEYSGPQFDAKIKVMANSGTLPDLGYFMGNSFYDYASKGMFLDLTTMVERDGIEKEYLAQTWLRYKDRIIGAYSAAEAQVMYYNKDVLRKVGIPFPPTDYTKAWTWDQAVNYWVKLTIDKNGRHPGAAGFDAKHVVRFGIFYETWFSMLYPAIWSNGGEVFSADGKQILIDSPATIQAVQRIADLRNARMVMSAPGLTEYNSTGKTDPKLLLESGQIAFYVSGAWELLDFNTMHFPLGIGALPIHKTPAQLYLSGVNVIYRNSKHPEEAWKLQKWMMNPEKVLPLYTNGLWMPTKSSWISNPDDLSKWLSNPAHPDGFKAAVVDSMKIARPEPINIKNYAQIWNDFINPELVKVWAGTSSAETALSAAARRIRASGLLQGLWQ